MGQTPRRETGPLPRGSCIRRDGGDRPGRGGHPTHCCNRALITVGRPQPHLVQPQPLPNLEPLCVSSVRSRHRNRGVSSVPPLGSRAILLSTALLLTQTSAGKEDGGTREVEGRSDLYLGVKASPLGTQCSHRGCLRSFVRGTRGTRHDPFNSPSPRFKSTKEENLLHVPYDTLSQRGSRGQSSVSDTSQPLTGPTDTAPVKVGSGRLGVRNPK